MRMPVVLGLLVLTGCPTNDGTCLVDSDCAGGEVCARNSECLTSSAVRVVRVEWTVGGMPASETSCATTQNLALNFYGDRLDDAVGFVPVPCKIGKFTVDKLPTRFASAELGRDGGAATVKAIDAAGTVRFDLAP
ncbi:MAG: hypothetical protein H0T79_20235 [Deltaproteobacteria bacterium]|nr:hypothetical protein [Deltaproteobacteria bacterium]